MPPRTRSGHAEGALTGGHRPAARGLPLALAHGRTARDCGRAARREAAGPRAHAGKRDRLGAGAARNLAGRSPPSSASTARSRLQDVLGAIDRLTQSTKESPGPLRAARSAHRHGDPRGRRAAEAARRRGAECRTDPTTALPTRATFEATLTKVLAVAAETRQPISVMLCNLDYFTAFNENFGNLSGRPGAALDRAAVQVAHAPGDTVARFPATQFAAILPQMRGATRPPARNVSARC